MAEVLFFIAAIGAIAGAVGVVTLQNPFYSVLALVFHLLSLAALFLLLQAQFVAAAQVVVYAGAVMVLYVFVVAYVGAAEPAHLQTPMGGGQRGLAIAFALALFVELAIALLGSGVAAIDSDGPVVGALFGSPEQIGEALLTKFLVPFEIASFLLLIAAVGGVVLARRRGGIARGGAARQRDGLPAPARAWARWPRPSRARTARRSASSARPRARRPAPGRPRRAVQ